MTSKKKPLNGRKPLIYLAVAVGAALVLALLFVTLYRFSGHH
jgi:hypothetical protein